MPFLQFMPCIRPKITRAWTLSANFQAHIKAKFSEHKASHQLGVVRDFCDALISSKIEAEIEQRDNAEYLNDNNLAAVLLDLFFAGTDTTRISLSWCLLLMANYPDVQEMIRKEVGENIGNEIVTIDNKGSLNYVQAFISEVLRFRPAVPFGSSHKAIVDSNIGNQPFPF